MAQKENNAAVSAGAGQQNEDTLNQNNQIVPFQENNDDQVENQKQQDESVSELPADMLPMMEEMESVLYSISFGKQENVGRTKF